MMEVRYLLDENLSPEWRNQLLYHQPDLIIWMIGDPLAPSQGTLDPAILKWCEEHQFLLVTNNRKSMPQHLADHLAARRRIPGIIALRKNAAIGSAIADLLLLAEVGAGEEFSDRFPFDPICSFCLTRSSCVRLDTSFCLTRSNFNLTRSNFNLTRSNFNLTRSNFNLTRSNFNLTRSNFYLTRSNFYLTRSNFYLTRSNAHTTRSNFYLTRSNAHTTRSNFCLTRSNLCLTRSDRVTDQKIYESIGLGRLRTHCRKAFKV
jgi:hypothetical protein